MCTDWDQSQKDAVWRAMTAVMVRQPRRVRIVNRVRRFIARPLFWLAAKIEPKRRPDGAVWNPLSFDVIRLAHENSATGTIGGYLMGPPKREVP